MSLTHKDNIFVWYDATYFKDYQTDNVFIKISKDLHLDYDKDNLHRLQHYYDRSVITTI